MKRISLFAVSCILLALAAGSAFAQGAQATSGKIGWIDTGAFAEDKVGITKYLNALKAIELEMQPRVNELKTIQAKLKTISDDIAKMNSNPAIPIDQKALAAKSEEGQRLQREGEFKKKELDAAVERRNGEVLGPVSQDITKAIQEFAKQKGFSAVLDIAMLDQARVILALDSAADITKEFIAYYNARPASATAAAGTPK